MPRAVPYAGLDRREGGLGTEGLGSQARELARKASEQVQAGGSRGEARGVCPQPAQSRSKDCGDRASCRPLRPVKAVPRAVKAVHYLYAITQVLSYGLEAFPAADGRGCEARSCGVWRESDTPSGVRVGGS